MFSWGNKYLSGILFIESKDVEDESKIYLFQSGVFYILLYKDVKRILDELGIKIKNYNKVIVKCGFFKEQFKEYSKFFKLLLLEYEIYFDFC